MIRITFLEPAYLWLLLLVPLVAVAHLYFLRYTKRKAMQFANFAVLRRATGQRFITRNHLLLALRLSIIVLAVLGAARTVAWYDGNANENEYVIALDTSASMAAQDFAPDRLTVAKEQARAFIDTLDPDTRVGLVTFSGVTFIEQTLTTDRAALKDALDKVTIEASGTDIPGAVITSTNLLVTTERGRAIILITDGSNTIETFESRGLQRAAGYAAANRVRINTIAVGSDTGPIGYLPTFYNLTAAYDTSNLEYLSNYTGGSSYNALNPAELAGAYDQIQSDTLASTLSYDLSGILFGLALILLVMEWVMGSTRFRALP
jgi:Ca-activated chloride channel family protein